MRTKLSSLFLSTRFKITLWYSVIFLSLELLIGISVYYYLYISLNKELDYSLSRQSEAVYNLIIKKNVNLTEFEPDSVYSSTDELVYDLIYEAVVSSPRNTYMQVGYKNKIIFSTENIKGAALEFPKIKESTVVLKNGYNENLTREQIRFAYLKKDDYKIIVAFPLDLISETLNNLTDIYIIIAPLFFIVSILGGAVISARSLSRIDTIIKETKEITAYNLNKKIDGENFNDEYGRLVRTMNSMINRIKTSIDYMNQFSVSASHELKTPLTIIRGEIEVALKSPKTPEEYREILKSNYEEAIRLSNIVDRLFLISKIENSELKISRKKVHINEFLINIKNKYDHFKDIVRLITERNVTVEIEPELMKEAVFNLLDNAYKYGDAEHKIILRSKVIDDSKVKISVINKGEAIPPEFHSKIFERFFRIESSRNRDKGGTGIGLAIVKSIAAWHNAEVTVNSDPDNYTEFSIILNYCSDE